MVEDQTIPTLISRANELTKRLRMLEEQFAAFQEKLDDIMRGFIKRNNDIDKSLKEVTSSHKSIISDLVAIKKELKEIRKETTRFAPSEKVEELEGFINLLSPMEAVTREEVRKIVEEMTRGTA